MYSLVLHVPPYVGQKGGFGSASAVTKVSLSLPAEGVHSSWIKIKNAHYSQIVGRDEKFERLERPHEPQQAGWASCATVCARG